MILIGCEMRNVGVESDEGRRMHADGGIGALQLHRRAVDFQTNAHLVVRLGDVDVKQQAFRGEPGGVQIFGRPWNGPGFFTGAELLLDPGGDSEIRAKSPTGEAGIVGTYLLSVCKYFPGEA